jgi:hypothetical protein
LVRKLICFAVYLALFLGIAPTESGAQSEKHDWLIIPGERIGPITAQTSEEEIIKIFGIANVRREDIGVGEGETLPGTVIYPKDLRRRLAILWKDEKTRKAPTEARLYGRSSVWKTKNGISLGSPLKEIEKLNGKPFILMGFAWDYGGTIIDCNHGRLKEIGCIRKTSSSTEGRNIILRLAPEAEFDGNGEFDGNKDYEAVLGDQEFSSAHPSMQKLNPRVYEITVVLQVGR